MGAETLQEAVAQARVQRHTRLGQQDWGVGLAEAYAIQAALFPGPLKGYKLGLISPAKQAQMGLSTPIWGRVHPGMLLEEVRLSAFIQPRLEPELAVVLRHPLPAGASLGQAAQAVGGFFLAVDVLDSIWADYRFSAPEVVADNTSGGGFLLGLTPLEGLPAGELCLYLNGELLTQGPTEALGDPYARLAWLAGEVGGLKAGQVVFLGSPAPAQPARPGVLEVCSSTGGFSAPIKEG